MPAATAKQFQAALCLIPLKTKMEPPKMTWDMDDMDPKDESSGSDSPSSHWDFYGISMGFRALFMGH